MHDLVCGIVIGVERKSSLLWIFSLFFMHLFLAASGNLAAIVFFMSMLASFSFLQLQKTVTIRQCALSAVRYVQSSCQAEKHVESSSNKAKAIFVLGGKFRDNLLTNYP